MNQLQEVIFSARCVRKKLREHIGLKSKDRISFEFSEDDEVLTVYTNHFLNGLRCVYFISLRDLFSMFDVPPARQSLVYRVRIIRDCLLFCFWNA